MSLNLVAIQGRMVNDPALKTTQSGISVCAFSVAVNRPKRNGEEQPADFVDVVAWRGTAEFICKWFSKGDPIIVNGRLQTRSYEDKNGIKRKATEVVANEINFAGKSNGSHEKAAEPSMPDEDGFMNIEDDELPF